LQSPPRGQAGLPTTSFLHSCKHFFFLQAFFIVIAVVLSGGTLQYLHRFLNVASFFFLVGPGFELRALYRYFTA
jgi:hypothetical protein